ncbi:putative phosphatidylethanolamine-binding protein [Arcobacter venerupis]|uniref:Phosphatidylethanolamine-binding protein n=1 Tax=Arcobacter venerupis TaxID=1054033 RepID=A0AAE7BBV9_9BACT|nr:YbhB/YbcL family Raf kinase inhibitor-like protein [Arcobacter venerupis]QKF67422.1 putative phosphatidylethanolamine-binding protein [Arcobacter venerupis]RWS50563.1 phosphatidylethanolamine-binding protein [Arcobacter venerupis]
MKKIFLGLIFSMGLFAQGFTLSSNDISGQLSSDEVFNGFGCIGKNISPELSWKDAPKGTKSFAITVYDPDAPTGSGWWHWVVFNISKDKNTLEKGFGNKESTNIVQSVTDYGITGFGGACPPLGDKAHRYVFTVYALDVESLDLDKKTNAAVVGFYVNSHTLAKSSIIAYYGR